MSARRAPRGPARREPGRDLGPLQDRLGHRFADESLLRRALTHKSAGDGQPGFAHNERLEWLGDRVLGLLAARHLFEVHARAEEGELTRQFNAVVNGRNCAEAARALGIGDLVDVARSLQGDTARDNDSVLGDAYEAVMAALYLDGGLAAAEPLFRRALDAARDTSLGGRNTKSALQEWAQKRGLTPPVYTVTARDGPDHAPRFQVAVEVAGRRAEAWGASKQAAEQEAALGLIRQEKLDV